jgi:tRNA dimethylallyltransferase
MIDSGSQIKRDALLIAGATASGKSALALEKAKQIGGFVINADSMQVYDVMNILTARPSQEDLESADHFLYGHVSPRVHYSVAQWVRDVKLLLNRDDLKNRRPIFVGGTGLYFKALMGGLSEMPTVPDLIRNKWREELAKFGSEKLYELLCTQDIQASLRIKPQDGQRIIRALEIFECTGKTISFWQSQKSQPLIEMETSEIICLMPDRSIIDENIAKRLANMVKKGVLDEVAAMMVLKLDVSLPSMKAIGLPQFIDHLSGICDIETALELAQNSTHQYMKRQTTWFRHQLMKKTAIAAVI